MTNILSLWFSPVVLRFMKDTEKKLYRNLELSTPKLKKRGHTSCSVKPVITVMLFNAYELRFQTYNRGSAVSRSIYDHLSKLIRKLYVLAIRSKLKYA